jgi:hypothetical protein
MDGWRIGGHQVRAVSYGPIPFCHAPAMFTLLSALKLITEVALLALVGQWVLAWLSGPRRHGNVFYQVLEVVGRPALWLARRLSPPVVLDRHVPLVAFVLLVLAWAGLTLAKIGHCLEVGMASCR